MSTGRFIRKGILFGVILAVVLSGCLVLSSFSPAANTILAYLTDSGDYNRSEESAKEKALRDCTVSDNGYTKLIIGDSVCWMLFTPLQKYNDTYLIAGSSRPFTLAGQYVQVKEFLENHPDATDIYMFESESTWESVLDAKNSYQNLVVPTIRTGTFQDLDANTRAKARRLFGPVLLQPAFARIFDYSNTMHKIVLNGIVEFRQTFYGEDLSAEYESTPGELSPVTLQYLPKIIALCQENHVTLHFMHDPLADTPQKHAELTTEESMFTSQEYGDIYQQMSDTVLYYPESYFFDGVHLQPADVQMNRQVIRDIISHSGEMTDFVVPEK